MKEQGSCRNGKESLPLQKNLTTMNTTRPSCSRKPSCVMAADSTETPWAQAAARVLSELLLLDQPAGDSEQDQPHTDDLRDSVFSILDRQLETFSGMDYYQRLGMTFSFFHEVTGAFLHQSLAAGEGRHGHLAAIAVSVILRSMREPPFSVSLWRSLLPYFREEARPLLASLLDRVELSLMEMLGQSVYSFFEDDCPREKVDRLLEEACRSVTAAESVRCLTSRHGNGHTRLIIGYVLSWQERGLMKRVPRIMPFLRSLEAYWHHDCRLGCRQGVERMYTKRTMYA